MITVAAGADVVRNSALPDSVLYAEDGLPSNVVIATEPLTGIGIMNGSPTCADAAHVQLRMNAEIVSVINVVPSYMALNVPVTEAVTDAYPTLVSTTTPSHDGSVPLEPGNLKVKGTPTIPVTLILLFTMTTDIALPIKPPSKMYHKKYSPGMAVPAVVPFVILTLSDAKEVTTVETTLCF
jgi:hypothetical protein